MPHCYSKNSQLFIFIINNCFIKEQLKTQLIHRFILTLLHAPNYSHRYVEMFIVYAKP